MDNKAQWSLVAAAWFLALSVAVIGVLAWQRLNAPAAPVQAASPPGGAWALRGDGTALCPVTGQVLHVLSDTPKVNYLGVDYYFSRDSDSRGHDARTRFLMDPDSFLRSPPQR